MIDIKEEIYIEELLLGFLRSDKYITLVKTEKSDLGTHKEYVLTFKIDKDFTCPLSASLDNNEFAKFFQKVENK